MTTVAEEVGISVPLLDLKAQYAPLRDEIQRAINEVCESQYFVMGPKVAALEAEVAEYSGAAHGIGVSSGTDALLVALMALDVGPGDEVVTTCYSFFATAGVIARLGARPVFLDIEPDTYNLDPAALQRFLEEKTEERDGYRVNVDTGNRVRVVMPVHLYGQLATMEPIMALADRYCLHVVEDAAQAIGSAGEDGRRAGAIGSIGCFSFFPSKNLGAFGDGGMCVSSSDTLAEKLRILRVHGGKPKYYHSVVGGNFRLDALQAAVLSVKLRYLDGWTAGRQRNAKRYDELLKPVGDRVSTPVTRSGNRHIFNQYVISVEDRDGLREFLGSRNIGSEVYYPVPLHRQECFAYLDYPEGSCPNAEHAAAHTIALPVYPELSEAQIEYVADAIREFVGE